MGLRNAVVLLLAFATTACGGGASPAAGISRLAGLPAAFGLPRVVAVAAYSSRAMLVDAVYQASALSGAARAGGMTTTGTLLCGVEAPRYTNEPTNRLVVELGAEHHEFEIGKVLGDNRRPTSAAWLAAPHTLSYHHEVRGGAVADVEVQFDGARFWVHVIGHTDFDGAVVEIDLIAEGAAIGARDLDAADTPTDYALTGTLSGTGFQIEVKEAQTIHFVAATSLRDPPGRRGSVTSVTTRIDSLLRSGDDEFQFDGVRVHSEHAEKGVGARGQDSQLSGRILHGRAPFGECVIEQGVPVLRTADRVIALVPR